MKLIMVIGEGTPYEYTEGTIRIEYSSAEDLKTDFESKIDNILLLADEDLLKYRYHHTFYFCGRPFDLADVYKQDPDSYAGDRRIKIIPQIYTLDEWFDLEYLEKK